MADRITIVDIAKEAGVSIKTVSNVINNKGNMRPETRAHVRDIIDKLGYQVNIAARSMRTGRTKLIGLGIADFSQPFNPYVTDSVIQAARARGYGVITSTYGYHNQDVESIITETHQLPADGWIFLTGQSISEDSSVFKQSYPVVLASDFNAFDKVDSVTMQSYEAVKDVVARLIKKGKQRIAFAGAPLRFNNETDRAFLERIQRSEFGTVDIRTKAYCNALQEYDLAVNPQYILSCELIDHKHGALLVKNLLNQIESTDMELPDVIVCANDALAFGIIHELAKNNIRMPDDVELVGFDNVPEAQYSNPTLTTINPHVDDYAQHAVDFVIERIEGYKGPARRYASSCTLEQRQSCQV
ncbi:LacI family DNA-binding transcriptional regulator [Alloscardovia omnicolens]|uniref:LacI family DNA-binding transcriptional regulator n=1 Tax=Alloscardovia omnicolens TaxID=419015 RepID=UPI003A6A308C